MTGAPSFVRADSMSAPQTFPWNVCHPELVEGSPCAVGEGLVPSLPIDAKRLLSAPAQRHHSPEPIR